MDKVYAQALWHVIKDGEDPAKAISSLHGVLVRRGHTGLLHKIAHAFKQQVAHVEQRNTVTLLVADKKDETQAKREAATSLVKLQLEDRHVITRVDHTLIGGWRTEGREHLVDASYKKFLLEIYESATKN
jgi:F0F1-type ATP synthase delta subunit